MYLYSDICNARKSFSPCFTDGEMKHTNLNNYPRSHRNSAMEERPAGDVSTEPVCLSGVSNKGTSNRLVKLT